jgi:streptogramin lyase
VRVDHARNRIWVGTATADAAFLFDPGTGRFTTYPLPSHGALVRHMAIDSASGEVWLAYGAAPGSGARIARIRPASTER